MVPLRKPISSGIPDPAALGLLVESAVSQLSQHVATWESADSHVVTSLRNYMPWLLYNRLTAFLTKMTRQVLAKRTYPFLILVKSANLCFFC
jgi:hypothetical protein